MSPTRKQLALPNDLYTSIPSYGMTGTAKEGGATQEQLVTLERLGLEIGLDFLDGFYWHFGDAVGADEQAFYWVSNTYPFNAITVAHPGVKIGIGEYKRAHCKASEIREPMEMISRNVRIAYLSHSGLFALPHEYNEILRSDMWSTVRAAGNLHRPTWIIKPNGLYEFHETGYQTVLRRETLADDTRDAWAL